MNKKHLVLFAMVILKLLFQYYAIDPGYELHRDEFLHIDLGKHLAWGYASVPPVTAWISYLIIHLGNTVFLVKLFPALFGALTIVVVWKTVEKLNGGWFALILSSVCVLFSVLLRINTLYQPNSLEFLLWTLMFYNIIRFIDTEDHKWLWIASITFAFGFLNKYNIAFLLLGLLPAILLTTHRRIFLNRHFYLSMFMAVLIITPNLIWQYQNDFPVFHHLQQLADKQLVNVNRFDFLLQQLLFFTGSVWVIILAFISFFAYAPFRKYQIFLWSYIFTIAIYFGLKAKGYYAIGLYPILLAFGSVYLEHLLKRGWLMYLRPVAILVPLAVTIPLLQYILPVLPPEEIVNKTEAFTRYGLLRWEDGKDHAIPQDYADMLGWRELAHMVDSAVCSLDQAESTLIQCDNYGQAGAINFYTQRKFTGALSMNADYINWYPLDKMEIRNVILVVEASDTDKDREREKPLFEHVSLVGEITNRYAREKGTRVYLLQGAKQSINDILRSEITNKKHGLK